MNGSHGELTTCPDPTKTFSCSDSVASNPGTVKGCGLVGSQGRPTLKTPPLWFRGLEVYCSGISVRVLLLGFQVR